VLLLYDIYPDVGERMGLLKPGGLVARAWRRASARSMLAAEGVITLGEHMAETLRGHLRPGDECPIEAIPNWADTDVIRPRPKGDNPFAREHGLVGKFVVMYSGSFGATHDTESIVEAAASLRDLADVQFVLIGGGTREREVADLVASRRLPNVTLLPFQPLNVLPFSLAAADCAVVCLDEGYEGVAVPSKTYHALAAGAAILAVSPLETELVDLIREEECGVHILPRQPEYLAEAVRRLHGDRALLGRMKAAARDAAEGHFSRRLLTRQYFEFLDRAFWGP
jgi:glycosyltransferase involved in cell wall biosynthesis